MPVEKQVAIIYLGTKGLVKDVPVNEIKEFESSFLLTMEQQAPEILGRFQKGKYEKDDLKVVERIANEMTAKYRK